MSAANKRRPHVYSPDRPADKQESLRQVKLECEHLRDKIQKAVIDNPQAAKKAALLISMWIEGKNRKAKAPKK